jgi:hypothetical protein
VKWSAGMHAEPNPADVVLYQRAVICQTFPAYKLSDLDHESAPMLLRALELLNTARKVQSS